MQQVLNAILQFLQQGITAIFKFFQLIYTWAFDQVMRLTQVPFNDWPLWKQIFFAIAALAVIALLVRAAKELFEAGKQVLEAFVTLLRVLVLIMPWVLAAGLVAFVALLIVNHVAF